MSNPEAAEATNSDTTSITSNESSVDKTHREQWLDKYFEPFLFELRYTILVPVVIGFIAGIIMFAIGTYQVYDASTALIVNSDFSATGVTLPIIKALDSFLVGIILVIFSFGVYDFFVSELEPAEDAGVRPDWFKFDSTGDLKNKLIEVVLVILSIKFFEQMVANAKNLESIEMYLVIPIGTSILAVSLGFFKWATH